MTSVQYKASEPAEELLLCDDEQVKLMNQECITVDEQDRVTGSKSKLKCHLQSENLPLHRAFSLFIFNSRNELLMQRRADTKITFAGSVFNLLIDFIALHFLTVGYYTNTCCSHPLHFPNELDENDNIGVKRAAQRRTFEELGVPTSQLPLDSINFLSRVHYKAAYDDKWGEHEMDYVLFARCDVDLNPNLNEISEVKYVSREGFDDFKDECKKRKIPLTPWFELIAESHLLEWWKNLDNLDKYTNQSEIIRCVK